MMVGLVVVREMGEVGLRVDGRVVFGEKEGKGVLNNMVGWDGME